MDNVILDVSIGLVLIYAVLSLLVTSVQEALSGTLLRGRVSVLHRLLFEATGQDPALKKRLLANPLMYALSEGDPAREGILLLRPPRGPSSVPPDVFARALLMEVDASAGGQPPSERHATPQQFIDALSAAGLEKPEAPERRTVGALRGLLVGHETDWAGFELAVAEWFAYIGDRSDGWFKRRATKFTFAISLALAVALNIDTLHIAQALSSDGELRSSLANIAERVAAQRAAGSAAELPAPTRAPDRPEVQVSARLGDAYSRLRPLYFQDDAIAGFQHRLTAVNVACTSLTEGKGTTPGVNGPNRAPVLSNKFVSDANAWVEIIPSLLPQIELAAAGKGSGERSPEKVLEQAYQCLVHLSSWVRAATTASKDPASQRAMQDAAAALEDSKSALLELTRQHTPPRALRRLFQTAPQDFEDCASAAQSLAELRRCTEERLDVVSRLPIGLTTANLSTQFCVVKSGKTLASLLELRGSDDSSLCSGQVAERPEIGLQAMVLSPVGPTAWLAAAAGVLVTTMFVMLGAPFWFDLLGKVVNLRAAGRRAEQDDNTRKANGTLPLLPGSPAAGGGGATAAAPRTGASPGDPSLNGFENQLTVREINALQQRLGVTPATGRFDLATREALKKAQGGDATLTPTSYLALVGRPALASETLVLGAQGRPRLRQPHPQVQVLAGKLMSMLQFNGRIPATETTFSDDLRALSVLYRYKNDSHPVLAERAVFDLARRKPAVLDELDDALMNEILSAGARLPAWDRDAAAPWLDWALGELGQVENGANSRKASNPRVCEYLDEVAPHFGDAGDATAWCGAFIAWVVNRHNGQLAGRPALASPPPSPGLAASWALWGTSTTAAPQSGDVVVVRSGASASGEHVGWCFAVDAGHVVLLGGNQSEGGRVCLSTFPRTALVWASRG